MYNRILTATIMIWGIALMVASGVLLTLFLYNGDHIVDILVELRIIFSDFGILNDIIMNIIGVTVYLMAIFFISYIGWRGLMICCFPEDEIMQD